MSFELGNLQSNWTSELKQVVDSYRDVADQHTVLWSHFYRLANEIPRVKRHRDYVEQHDQGFGDRAFHYLWKLLVDQAPDEFSFLEIGVYQGQIISLIPLLASLANKQATIHGVTPLDASGDKYSDYPDIDYLDRIQTIFQQFDLPQENLTIYQGLSTEASVKVEVSEKAPFDLVYIDGCHEYDVVVSDILTYGLMLKPGGFLVMDDASIDLDLPPFFQITSNHGGIAEHQYAFPGHADVSRAANDVLNGNPHLFRHLFACGHNRVWLRI